jgi:outer membrane lipopolysaccharide assembly protein LptE/RlpB
MSISRRRFLFAAQPAIVAAAAGALAGCGYSLAGRGSFLPAYIRRIAIPDFANATTIFDVERRITERVRTEFISRGSYTILTDQAQAADAVLTGQITSITLAPAAFTQEQQASRYVLTLIAKVEFRDLKASTVIWQNPSLQFREEYEITTGQNAGDVGAFFGQNTNALERLANEFARSVVSSILEAF